MNNLIEIIRASTLCKIGRHCRPSREVVKFDGGHMSHLCRYCRLILWRERP